MRNPLTALASASQQSAAVILSNRRLLMSITRVELQKKYAGSVLGFGWVFLQPILLLCVYLFIYLIVFDVRFPGFSTFDYVLYVFCGLVPYLGFMEALTTGGLSIRQNIHLVKNVMLPIELVPVRTVIVGMTSQFVSLVFVILLLAGSGDLTFHILWLPIVIFLQLLALIGLTWILAGLTVALPDVTYFVNLFTFLLMFISPIAFRLEMLPPNFTWVAHLNPVHYMIKVYRDSMLNGQFPSALEITVYAGGSLLMFALGAVFFRAFKGVLVDYE